MAKGAQTRLTILSKAFDLVYKNGYQATSIDHIIATTAVTKGALYHHFKNKDDMGLAIIKEVMQPGMHNAMVKPLLETNNACKDIYEMMEGLLIHNSFFSVKYGCPAVNLIEEMAPLNTKFANALLELMTSWQQAIETCIENGKQNGTIAKTTNAKEAAIFIISGYSGIRNMGKIMGPKAYTVYLKQLKNYLNLLS